MWGYLGRSILVAVATTVVRVLVMHTIRPPPPNKKYRK